MLGSRTNSFLEIRLMLSEFALDRASLDRVVLLLEMVAPSWLRRAKVTDAEPGGSTDLSARIAEAATRRGELYKRLVAHRPPPAWLERVFGTTELNGVGLTVIIHGDEFLVQPIGRDWIWGNRITFQVASTRFEGRADTEWALECLQRASTELEIEHGYAGTQAELTAQNLSTRNGVVQAVGMDPTVALPGLFWMNYFGPRYVSLIGRQRLEQARGSILDDGRGALLTLDHDPRDWDSRVYRSAKDEVLDAIGREFFFDPASSTVSHRAPQLLGAGGEPPRASRAG